MDPLDFIQQCAQEDQAGIHDYVTSSTASTSADSSIPLSDDVLPSGPRPGSSRPFNVSTRLIWNCAARNCSRMTDLTLCPTCKVVQYCSRYHLYVDRRNHRSVCAKLRKAQTQHASMSNRQVYVGHLLKINTAQAVTLALHHLLNMILEHPDDERGVRDVVPALFIRLGCDQEAYDFCRWWADAKVGKTCDAFEEVELFVGDRLHLSHAVAITLSKLRLIIDLQSLRRARIFAGPHVPRELLDVIQQHSTLSTITNRKDLTECEDYAPLIDRLREQVKVLFEAAHKANRHFWPALVEPGDNLEALPTTWEQGNERQMQLALQHNYNAWAETPGAIDAIAGLLKGVTRL